jgi:hypothetical protein
MVFQIDVDNTAISDSNREHHVFFRKDFEKNVFKHSSGENSLGVTTIYRGNLGSSLWETSSTV